ncbi:MAG: AAA family ATPase [Deltaproteobacteria bacterium]|nr:AAA family ATPase [Deltaproteobacteria bacterium]
MPEKVELFIFCGLIASGKSTLAEAWAGKLEASYYNSDRIRKELAGLQAKAPQRESFNAGIYTPEFSRRTYDRLLSLAETDLKLGKTVVLDGSYQARHERDRVRELGRRMGKALKFVLCGCSDKVTKERLAVRANDPEAVSDGRWEIYLQQKRHFSRYDEPGAELINLSTEAPVAELLDRLSAGVF